MAGRDADRLQLVEIRGCQWLHFSRHLRPSNRQAWLIRKVVSTSVADAHHVTARVPDCLPLYEERMETCLLEMRILRQCLSKSELAHDTETEAVREGVSVITVLQ